MILFNYCTYGYSFVHWSESDWDKYLDNLKKLFDMYPQKEGVSFLLVPGMEQVWFNILTKYYNYTEKEAESYICGPCYTPWWLMCNLYNTGGPVSKHWIERQARLGKHILKKIKENDWHVVMPGWNGMVPPNFAEKNKGITFEDGNNAPIVFDTINIVDNGTWNGFKRSPRLDCISDKDYVLFKDFAHHYYDELQEVFGDACIEYGMFPKHSIDLFHEGGNQPSLSDATAIWKKTFDVIRECNYTTPMPLVQTWQWTDAQKKCMDAGTDIPMFYQDMQSDIEPKYDVYGYGVKDSLSNAVFSTIHNFGWRTGVFGRVLKTVESYIKWRDRTFTTSWIPEGCTPDFTSWNNASLFTMAVLGSEIGDTISKPEDILPHLYKIYKAFGCNFDDSQTYELLKYAPICSTNSIQGPVEAIVCACPKLSQWQCSTWSSAFPQDTIKDALHFAALYIDKPQTWLKLNKGIFTMTKECVVQGLNIAAYKLLRKIKAEFESNGILKEWNTLKQQWYDLILDIETVQSLDSETDFKALINSFNNIIDTDYQETDKDIKDYEKDWLFRNNLKRQVTLWYDKSAAENGLGNYAYREYAGILSDFYLKRWKKYFETVETDGINWADSNIDWVQFAEDWINVKSFDWTNKYTNLPVEGKMSVLYNIFKKYFDVIYNEDGSISTIETSIVSDISGDSIPSTDNSDQDTINEYKQYLTSLSATLTDATTKEAYGTGSANLGISDVGWYSTFSLYNKTKEGERNVSLDFSVKGDSSTSTSGLAICCLFVYIKDLNTGKMVASRHFGDIKVSSNGFLNDYTDNITFALTPKHEYAVYFRVESSWSDNINSDGTLKDSTASIKRPSAYISIYKEKDSSDDDPSTDGTISNTYAKATGLRVNITKLLEACETDEDKKKVYSKLLWHITKIKSCADASALYHTEHTGKYTNDGTSESYLVLELKKMFEITE